MVTLFSFSGMSQGKWYVGSVAGAQFSSAYIEHTVYRVDLIAKTSPGFHAGLMAQHFADFKTSKKLNTGVRFGALYTQRGWDQDYLDTTSAGNIGTVTTKMDYLTIPFESIIYAANEDNRVFASLGVYLDFLLNYDIPDEPDDMDPINDFWTYNPNRDNTFGYGFKGGLGLQKQLGFGQLSIEGFFSYGLSNFIETNNRAEEIPDISNHWAVGGTIGYLIPIH
jgi:hypothetical protein